jgi:hypothetical protein
VAVVVCVAVVLDVRYRIGTWLHKRLRRLINGKGKRRKGNGMARTSIDEFVKLGRLCLAFEAHFTASAAPVISKGML